MKKIFLLSGIMILIAGQAQAGILSNIFGFNSGYNNGYYYGPNVRYTNGGYYPYGNGYYTRRYYTPGPYRSQRYNRYRYPGNYYRRPVIYRTNVKKSLSDSNEKIVANQMSGIDKLERKFLLQTYEYDSTKNRIERLEQKIFGASQTGDLRERLSTLKSVSKNYKAYDPNAGNSNQYSPKGMYSDSYRPPVFSGSSGAGWQNTLWGNFKNQFIGMPTGMTPAMDPAYMDYFEADRALMGNGQEVDYRTNRGYHRSKTNRGVTTGVTILD